MIENIPPKGVSFSDFIQQTNVTTFLTVIEQNTTAFLGNLRQCRFELEATIAAQAAPVKEA